MLPVEQDVGQLWLHGQFLCEVEYFISEPMDHVGNYIVQRIAFILDDKHCAKLLDAYNLILVIADGRRYAIPRPLQQIGLGCLECYVESSFGE